MARDGSNGLAGPQVLRRTTTTKRWVTRTVVVEELVPEGHAAPELSYAPPVQQSSPETRRRAEDIAAALAVTAGLGPPKDRRGSPRGGGGRRNGDRFLSDEELAHQARELRAYWASRVGKVHERLESRLRPIIIEFGLAEAKALIDEVRDGRGDRGPRDTLELLFSLMRRRRYERRKSEEEEGEVP